jgi:hypothetical protein
VTAAAQLWHTATFPTSRSPRATPLAAPRAEQRSRSRCRAARYQTGASERFSGQPHVRQPYLDARQCTGGRKLVVTAGSYGPRHDPTRGDTRRQSPEQQLSTFSWSATSSNVRRHPATTPQEPSTLMGFRWSDPGPVDCQVPALGRLSVVEIPVCEPAKSRGRSRRLTGESTRKEG